VLFEDIHIPPDYISNGNMWSAFLFMKRLHWKENRLWLNVQENINSQYKQKKSRYGFENDN